MAKKNKKIVAKLEDPTAYRNAVAQLNKARGKKSGDKGYITPSQALNEFRKYSSVEKIQQQIEKYNTDKELKRLTSQYNKYNGYNRGEAGFMNISSARGLNVEDLRDYVEAAKESYTVEVKQRAVYNKKVQQSLKDEEKLKKMADSVVDSINNAKEINKKQMEAKTQQEYDSLTNELKKAVADYKEKYVKFAEEDEKLHKKYRKMNKLPVSDKFIDVEKLKKMGSEDIQSAISETINRGNKKDIYGNPATLYSKYHSSVSQTVESILSAAMQTEVNISGTETKKLIEIINTEHIDNKKFWEAFHEWQNEGANVHNKNGEKYPNFITASSFFATGAGNKLLNDMLKPEYKNTNVEFVE